METGQASVSMLQRRLKLGYSRAARIVDEMETHCAAKYWPYPSYGDILFSVK